MMEHFTICLLKLLTVYLLISHSVGLLVVKTINVECFGTSSYVQNISCKLKPVNRDKSALYMDADVVHPLKNLTIHLQLFKKNDANQFQPFIVNIRGNLCAIMDNKISSHYISIIKRILKSNTNIVHKCPYAGHLKANELYFDPKFFPVIPPTGIYKVISIYRDSITSDLVGKMIFQAEVREVRTKKV